MTTETKLRAFHNDPKIKQKYIDRIRFHRQADHLVRGTGWEGGKGCAIGCTLESYEHSRYPIELGLPEWLAHLEDSIFEGLPNDQAMTWPERLLEAIPVGADVEPVRDQLAVRRMNRLLTLMHDLQKDDVVDRVIDAIKQVRDALSGDSQEELSAAWSAARSAARSARSAARSAESAAWSAESAAWSAARSAARSARSAARSAAWSAAESDELIELLSSLQAEQTES